MNIEALEEGNITERKPFPLEDVGKHKKDKTSSLYI